MRVYSSVDSEIDQPGLAEAAVPAIPPDNSESDFRLDRNSDHEILFQLLSRSIRGQSANRLAGNLISRFGGLGAVLAASPEVLSSEAGLCSETVSDLKLIEAVTARLAQSQIMGREVISSWDALLTYCRVKMVHREIEHLRVLFLDTRNRLISDELLQSGTVDHVPVYPREIARKALEKCASALILVHNHPSGDPTPSQPDIEMTGRVAAALQALDVQLHDHIIVSSEADFSFRANGLL